MKKWLGFGTNMYEHVMEFSSLKKKKMLTLNNRTFWILYDFHYFETKQNVFTVLFHKLLLLIRYAHIAPMHHYISPPEGRKIMTLLTYEIITLQ